MSKSEGRTRQPGIYYGWVIVVVSLVSMAFWLGIRSSFSVFYVALLDDFHWTRAGSAGVQSIALITYTLLAPLVGGLIDRFGPRRVVVPGILILAFGLILCSSIKTVSLSGWRPPASHVVLNRVIAIRGNAQPVFRIKF